MGYFRFIVVSDVWRKRQAAKLRSMRLLHYEIEVGVPQIPKLPTSGSQGGRTSGWAVGHKVKLQHTAQQWAGDGVLIGGGRTKTHPMNVMKPNILLSQDSHNNWTTDQAGRRRTSW
jgi:hypothetical protein